MAYHDDYDGQHCQVPSSDSSSNAYTCKRLLSTVVGIRELINNIIISSRAVQETLFCFHTVPSKIWPKNIEA